VNILPLLISWSSSVREANRASCPAAIVFCNINATVRKVAASFQHTMKQADDFLHLATRYLIIIIYFNLFLFYLFYYYYFLYFYLIIHGAHFIILLLFISNPNILPYFHLIHILILILQSKHLVFTFLYVSCAHFRSLRFMSAANMKSLSVVC